MSGWVVCNGFMGLTRVCNKENVSRKLFFGPKLNSHDNKVVSGHINGLVIV